MELSEQLKAAQDQFRNLLFSERADFAASFLRSNPSISTKDFENVNRVRVETVRSAVARPMKVGAAWGTVDATNTFSLNSQIGSTGQDAADMTQQATPFLVEGFYFSLNDDVAKEDLINIYKTGRVEITSSVDGFRKQTYNFSDCCVNPLTQQSIETDTTASTSTGYNANGLVRSGGQASPWCALVGGLGLLAGQKAQIKIVGLNTVAMTSTITLQLNLIGRVGY